LRGTGEVVERYANEAVAHLADERRHDAPTFADLNAAIDSIGALMQRYSLLLKAHSVVDLEPAIQHDWKAPFRQAWIPG
jgi:hypothetical protein